METQEKELIVYETLDGHYPFWEWVESLPRTTQVRIDARLARVRAGNLGDIKSVGDGVYELRIHQGPGYRVYIAQHSQCIVILLTGGDKSKQKAEIEKAKDYWKDYRSKNP